MKIKMHALQAGPDGCRKRGQIVQVSEDEGRALIAGGYAVAVKRAPEVTKPAPVETATLDKREAVRGNRPKSRRK